MHRLLLSLAIPLLLTAATTVPVRAQSQSIRVGFVVDGPWERNQELHRLFQEEILELTQGEFDVQFLDQDFRVADWTLSGAGAALDALLADRGVDLVIALGVLSSHEAAGRSSLGKPVIAPIVVDAGLQGLPERQGTSGVRNLNYLTYPDGFDTDLASFREILDFKKLTILAPRPLTEALPQLREQSLGVGSRAGIELQVVPVGESAAEALTALDTDTEAVYLTPLFQLSREEFDTLVRGLVRRKLPSYSLLGETEVKRGILASTNPDVFPRMARRVALNVQRILLGEDAGSLSVSFSGGTQWFVNMNTARAIGVYPSWSLLTEATLIEDRSTITSRTLDLFDAVREALAGNRDLVAFSHRLAAGNAEIKSARSNLLPQLDLGATGVIIDKDRAEASFGSQAERTLSGSATLTQVLYSEDARANLGVERHLQDARRGDWNTLRQDVIQDAATAYLNVLRAKTLERIQRENLSLTRSNLALAKVRETVGFSGRADVFRWESQIATNRKNAIDANAQRNVAEIAVNRIIHRPLEDPFQTRDLDLAGSSPLPGFEPVFERMGNKQSFEQLREAMVELGLDSSPELASLDASIAAQERLVTRAKRAFWLPTLGVQGDVTNRFSRGGVGSSPAEPISAPGFDFSFPQPDDTDWSVALSATFPLFTGGNKTAESRRAFEAAVELRVQRDAVRERLEQRIRSSLHLAGASLAGIEQARLATAAARSNLELVSDAYARGTVSVIDLLDAQNAYLIADESAANATYGFFSDFIEVQRAVGQLDVLVSEASRATFVSRVISRVPLRTLPR